MRQVSKTMLPVRSSVQVTRYAMAGGDLAQLRHAIGAAGESVRAAVAEATA
jgi:hypothetical protein